MSRLAPLAAWIVLALLLSAEARGGLHVVDGFGVGGTYQTIQQAVDAAVDGDVVLVKGGVYDAFVVDGKDLVVTIEDGVTNMVWVRVHPQSPLLTVRNLAAVQSVTVRGIEFGYFAFVPGQPLPFQGTEPVLLKDNAGPVLLEDVRVTHAGEFDAIVVDHCASVALSRCQSYGAPSRTALVAEESSTFVYDSFLFGGPGFTTDLSIPPTDGGPGARVRGGELLLSGGIVRGGDGVNNTFDPQTLSCTPASDGGAGVHLEAGAPLVRTLGAQIVGGEGGVDLSHTICTLPSGADGAPVDVDSGQHLAIAQTARSFSLGKAQREGLPLAVTLDGVAQDAVVLFVQLDHVAGAFSPTVNGVFLPAAPAAAAPFGSLPAGGSVATSVFVPSLPPAAQAVPVVAQPAFVAADGSVVMGAPSVTTLLDALVL